MTYTAHSSAIIDAGATIGIGTKIWHFSHICSKAKIGSDCSLGQNVFVGNDVLIGNIHGCDFFMSAFQFEYWQYTQLTLDVVEGRGASFSLEIPLGLRFIIRSQVYTEDELNNLAPVFDGEGGNEI